MTVLNGHLTGLEKEDLVNGFAMSKIGHISEKGTGVHPSLIWRSDDGEMKCVGSIAELQEEVAKAVAAGIPIRNVPMMLTYTDLLLTDLHR